MAGLGLANGAILGAGGLVGKGAGMGLKAAGAGIRIAGPAAAAEVRYQAALAAWRLGAQDQRLAVPGLGASVERPPPPNRADFMARNQMTQTGPGGAGQSALPPGLTRAQQIEAAARLKGAARQEALAELLPGWNKAAPYVGKPATEANLPPGMLYGKIPLSNGKFKLVGYLPGKPSGNVPRFEAVPGGTWQVKGMGADGGKLTSDPRIANASEYNKTNPPPRVPGQTGLTQNHHMTPDNIMRGNELFQRGFELGVTSPDRASGMINLATSKSSLETLEGNGYSMSQITHNTKHPRSDALIAEELDTFIAKEQVNGRLPSNLSTAKPKEVQDAIRRWDDQMRDQFMNKPDSFIRNEDGTLAENSSLDTQGRA